MLKVRLMGTKNDIKWFGKILQRNPKIEVTEFSDLYPNTKIKEITGLKWKSEKHQKENSRKKVWRIYHVGVYGRNCKSENKELKTNANTSNL